MRRTGKMREIEEDIKPDLGEKVDITVTRINVFTHQKKGGRPIFKVALEVDDVTLKFINMIRYTIVL